MGIQINLTPKQAATTSDIILDKLKVCYETMRFFKDGLFSPESVEVWIKAPSEALGGILMKSWEATNLYEAANVLDGYLRKLHFDQLVDSIAVFRGTWLFDQVNLGGYFSIYNNTEWRKTYGDIEISAYARKDFEDIVDALWATQDMTTFIPLFLDSLQRGIEKTLLNLSQITFSRGIPTEEDPSNLMAVYLVGERRGLLNVFYKARRKSMDPDVVSKSEPLNTFFLLKTLTAQEVVMQRINKKLSDTMVAEVKSKSALYIAKDKNSFEKLYNEISKSILKPALEKLPKEEIVRDAILTGLEEYKEPE